MSSSLSVANGIGGKKRSINLKLRAVSEKATKKNSCTCLINATAVCLCNRPLVNRRNYTLSCNILCYVIVVVTIRLQTGHHIECFIIVNVNLIAVICCHFYKKTFNLSVCLFVCFYTTEGT